MSCINTRDTLNIHPVLQWYDYERSEPGTRDVLEKITSAAELLERSMDIRLIPENGACLAYAVSGARDNNGVAVVQGGIIRKQEKPHAAGPCAFGAGVDIARIVLTVMKFDPGMRCVATLRFSGTVLKVAESLLLECTCLTRHQNHRESVPWTGELQPAVKRVYPTYVTIPEAREKKELSVFLVKIQST